MEAGAEWFEQRGLLHTHRGRNQVRILNGRDGELCERAGKSCWRWLSLCAPSSVFQYDFDALRVKAFFTGRVLSVDVQFFQMTGNEVRSYSKWRSGAPR